MGFGGISVWQLLIVLAIVILIFGTKKLKNIGGDLGGAIKNFKNSVKEEEKKGNTEKLESAETEDTNTTTKEQEKV